MTFAARRPLSPIHPTQDSVCRTAVHIDDLTCAGQISLRDGAFARLQRCWARWGHWTLVGSLAHGAPANAIRVWPGPINARGQRFIGPGWAIVLYRGGRRLHEAGMRRRGDVVTLTRTRAGRCNRQNNADSRRQDYSQSAMACGARDFTNFEFCGHGHPLGDCAWANSRAIYCSAPAGYVVANNAPKIQSAQIFLEHWTYVSVELRAVPKQWVSQFGRHPSEPGDVDLWRGLGPDLVLASKAERRWSFSQESSRRFRSPAH